MRKIILSIVIITLLPILEHANHEYEVLDSILLLADETDLELKTWEVIAIDTLSVSKKQQVINWLQTSTYDWIIKEEGQVKSFVLSNNGHMNITIKIGQTNKIQVIISGEEWSNQNKLIFNQLWSELNTEIFTKYTNIYTCVKLIDNDIMIDGIYTEELPELLNVTPVFEQVDNLEQTNYEVELYGYNPLWSTEININNDVINFQMAIKSHQQNKKEIIIGTPAILNEY